MGFQRKERDIVLNERARDPRDRDLVMARSPRLVDLVPRILEIVFADLDGVFERHRLRQLVLGRFESSRRDGDLQVDVLGVLHQGLRVADRLLRGDAGGLCLGQLRLSHGDLPRAGSRPGLRRPRLGHSDRGLGGLDLSIEQSRVQPDEQLVGGHTSPFDYRDLYDAPTELASDGNLLNVNHSRCL